MRHFGIEKLFLHLGPPKTGTTSLQKVFAEGNDQLASENIFFFLNPAGEPGHHWLKEEVLRAVSAGSKQFGLREPTIDELIRQFRDSGRNQLLISTETLVTDPRNPARRLVKELRPSETRMIFALRAPSKWVSSVQAQRVYSGFEPSRAFGEDFLEHFLVKTLRRMRKNIELMLESNANHLDLVVMDGQTDETLEDLVSKALGLTVPLTRGDWLNRRTSPCHAKLSYVLNDLLKSRSLSLEVRGNINFYLHTVIEEYLDGHHCVESCFQIIDGNRAKAVVSEVKGFQDRLQRLSTQLLGLPAEDHADPVLFFVPAPVDSDYERAAALLPRAYVRLMETATDIWKQNQGMLARLVQSAPDVAGCIQTESVLR